MSFMEVLIRVLINLKVLNNFSDRLKQYVEFI